MRIIYFSIIFGFVSATGLDAQPHCKLKKDQDSVRVYTCHTDTSRFKSIMAEFTLHATLDQLSQFVLDAPNYTHWQYNTIEAKTIKRISDSEQIYQTVIEAPWPVTNRDMVVHIRTKYDPDNHRLIITTESEANILPERVGPKKINSNCKLNSLCKSTQEAPYQFGW